MSKVFLLLPVLFLVAACATQEPAKPKESAEACPEGSHVTINRMGKPRCCPAGAACD